MTDELPPVPLRGGGILNPSPELEGMRCTAPAVQVRTPAGDTAWFLTRYETLRTMWPDPRLGVSHPTPETAARMSDSSIFSGPRGDYETETEDHARMRQLLGPAFSARRMARLDTFVQGVVDELVDGMLAEHAETGGPVDLHEHVSVPLPLRVIGELLGVPASEHPYFRDLTERAMSMSGDDPVQAYAEMHQYCLELADRKRANPGEDMVSDLVAAQAEHPNLPDEVVAQFCAIMLMAGHETVVARIDLGVLLLADDPDSVAVLAKGSVDDAAVNEIVEEILRLTVPSGLGMLRYAHEDVVIGEGDDAVTIPTGDAVLFNVGASNHDPRAFEDPDTFNPSRPHMPHLTFGWGPHYCVGSALGRIELRRVFTTLAARLPRLRPAVAFEDLPVNADLFTGGVSALPLDISI